VRVYGCMRTLYVCIRDVNKDLTPKNQDQDKDLTPKDQDKDKDLTLKDQDKDNDLTLKNKDMTPRTRTRTTARQIILIAYFNLLNVHW